MPQSPPISDRMLTGGAQLHMPSDAEFRSLAALIKDRFGIHLTDAKRSLVAGRLQKILRERSMATYQEYIDFLATESGADALDELANRITTNYTFFNRESDHFTYFSQHILPEMTKRHAQDRDLRVWCAGCSTGEEPWTLAMLIQEHLSHDSGRWDAGLLATDISDRALQIAKEGEYPLESLERLPVHLRSRYMVSAGPDAMHVSDKLKPLVTFRRFNLMNATFPFKKPMDCIFCRNVMIYFDGPTRQALVDRFAKALAPGGYLIIGHSESLGQTPVFESIIPALFRKK